MSWHDRPYNRHDFQSQKTTQGGFGGLGSKFNWSSITGWLIAINVAVFLIDLFATGNNNPGPMKIFGFFSYDLAINHFQVWRLISFQFIHANGFHLLFNMIALYFFGPMIEQYLGSRRYLAYYLLCGVAGAVMYMILMLSNILHISPDSAMVGASAGIFGILAGAAVIAPNTKVMLMIPPIPMKLRTLALVFLGISVFTVFRNGQNAGGEAAHLGGAILGFLLIRRADWLNFALLGGANRGSSGGRRGPTGPAAASPVTPATDRKTFKQRVTEFTQEREQKKMAALEKEIDRILIKVKEQGMHNLTEAEKKTLQQETQRKRGS